MSQSLLARNGFRSGVLGSDTDLAIAAPLGVLNPDPAAHTHANRIGFYFSRDSGEEKVATVVMGVERFAVTATGVELPAATEDDIVLRAKVTGEAESRIEVTAKGGFYVGYGSLPTNIVLDIYTLRLFNADGVPRVAWSNGWLLDLDGNSVVDWATGLMSNGANASLNWFTKVLVFDNTHNTLDWENTELLTSTGTSRVTANWNTRVLRGSANVTTVDWQNGYLRFNTVGNAISIDWILGELHDTSNITGLKWNDRELNDIGGTANLIWGVTGLVNVIGRIQIGENGTVTDTAGQIRWTGTVFEGYYGAAWDSLGAVANVNGTARTLAGSVSTTVNWETGELRGNDVNNFIHLHWMGGVMRDQTDNLSLHWFNREMADPTGTVNFAWGIAGEIQIISARLKLSDAAVSDSAGHVRWNGTDFEGYDGSSWKSFTTPSSGVGGANIVLGTGTPNTVTMWDGGGTGLTDSTVVQESGFIRTDAIRVEAGITGEAYMEWFPGDNATNAPSGAGRIRYNGTFNYLEYSENGGGWSQLITGGGPANGVSHDGSGGSPPYLPKWSFTFGQLDNSVVYEDGGTFGVENREFNITCNTNPNSGTDLYAARFYHEYTPNFGEDYGATVSTLLLRSTIGSGNAENYIQPVGASTLRIQGFNNSNAGTIAGYAQVQVELLQNFGGGVVTESFGVYVAAKTSGATTEWGFYSVDAFSFLGGGVTLGNPATAPTGTIRWSGAAFEGYDGSSWTALGGPGTLTGNASANQVTYWDGTTSIAGDASFTFDLSTLQLAVTSFVETPVFNVVKTRTGSSITLEESFRSIHNFTIDADTAAVTSNALNLTVDGGNTFTTTGAITNLSVVTASTISGSGGNRDFIGIYNSVTHTGLGLVGTMTGVVTRVSAQEDVNTSIAAFDGTVTITGGSSSAISYGAHLELNAGTGSGVTIGYGVKVDLSGGGIFSTMYGYHVDFTGSTVTNRWAFYAPGANDKVHFNGNVLLATTTDDGISNLQLSGAMTFRSTGGPAAATSGTGIVYYDGTFNRLMASYNGSGYSNIVVDGIYNPNTGGAGGSTTYQGGQAGNATSGTGGTGGGVTIVSGAAGTATTGFGGVGGVTLLTTGAGGNVSNNAGTGGAGGQMQLHAGVGGNAAAGDAGAGGAIQILGGTGGGSATSGLAGSGGIVTVRGGSGGTSNSGDGGNGADVTVQGGTGGVSTSGNSGGGGHLYLKGGFGEGTGFGGDIKFYASPTDLAAEVEYMRLTRNGEFIVGSGFTGANSCALQVHGAQAFEGVTEPSVSASDSCKIYHDITVNKIRISENGGTFLEIVPRTCRTTSDFSIQNSTTLTNVPNLALVVEANTTYRFRFVVFFRDVSTGGVRLQLTGPAAAGSIVYTIDTVGVTDIKSVFAIITDMPSASGRAVIEGILVNGANAGTLRVQACQSTLNNSAADDIVEQSFGEMSIIL